MRPTWMESGIWVIYNNICLLTMVLIHGLEFRGLMTFAHVLTTLLTLLNHNYADRQSQDAHYILILKYLNNQQFLKL